MLLHGNAPCKEKPNQGKNGHHRNETIECDSVMPNETGIIKDTITTMKVWVDLAILHCARGIG